MSPSDIPDEMRVIGKSFGMGSLIWEALESANMAMDLVHEARKFSSVGESELDQVCTTLDKVKQTLGLFTGGAPRSSAWDVCFSNVKSSLVTVRDQLDLITPEDTVLDHALLRDDLLLSLRVDELQTLFSPSRSAPIFQDKCGETFWHNSFGNNVYLFHSSYL
jgi:hypothetical protein